MTNRNKNNYSTFSVYINKSTHVFICTYTKIHTYTSGYEVKHIQMNARHTHIHSNTCKKKHTNKQNHI